MAVLYSQIRNLNNKVITANYSHQGLNIQDDSNLLNDLAKNVSNCNRIINQDQIISGQLSVKETLKFYVTLKGSYILVVIVDRKSNDDTVNRYFKNLHQKIKSLDVLNYSFDNELKTFSNNFNSNESNIKSNLALEGVHSTVVDSLNALINRGDKINEITTQAQNLNFHTMEMSKKVQNIRKKEQMEKYKMYVLLLIVLFVLYLIFFRK
ncbi:hypothetical protein A0H76_1422 [Hepatospora eriocheir]|uniref:V-SNARE coiled-coil homology domain-containing protein n=1 Tax=Hepatospora eriocheir TaxID=1081669 RepID=A0A1X0QH60_9MICR|nr:hypothetical protein A0H76_1422 [Hepatospora eriocheir]